MASKFDIKVKGLDDFTRAINAQAERIDHAAEMIVRKGAAIVGSQAKREFYPRPTGSRRISKNGRIYYDSKGFGLDGPGYDGSFAPRPPHPTSRSGNLRNSIHMIEAKQIGPGKWMSSTGPTMMYGAMVEQGTSRSRAFPYMKPGLEKSSEKLKTLYTAEWSKALA